MGREAKVRRAMPKKTYYFWVGVFLAVIFSIIFLIYFATMRIDYVWAWHKIPSAFLYHKQVEIKADIQGTVAGITPVNDQSRIVVKGDGEEKTFTVPTRDLRVAVHDFVYPGDTLASYGQWQAGIMLQGLWITLKVSLFAIIFGIIIGIIGGLSRISDNPAAKWLAITYVELIRGSPLLVQIFIWYFVVGTMVNQMLLAYGIHEIPGLWYGIAALACFTGAYVTEIVRAGIQSIGRGQMEAARSLGMSYAQSMRHIIMPQAMRRILPPLAGQFISLIKDSSLLGIIAVRELTKATREVITTQLNPFEMFFVCAGLYLVMTFALSMFVQYLERRTMTT
ncbi:MAG: ABC transporter permease subunit [Desulfobacterales bacterium]